VIPAQLAINSITTRHRTLDEALAGYAAAGFTNVEFHLPGAKAVGVKETYRLLERFGLRSIGGFETPLACFGSADERARSLETVVENARFLNELGGGVLVVGTDGPTEPSERPISIVSGALEAAADAISALDVELALEFNWSPVIRSLESAVAVVEETSSPKVGVLFDLAHYHTTVTKLEHLTRENIQWIKHVHLDDMSDTPGDLASANSDRALPGDGVLDLARIIDVLELGGYLGYFSVELFNDALWSLPPAEAAKRCYAKSLAFCA
jgi:2-keto-myo-inositol isomerase